MDRRSFVRNCTLAAGWFAGGLALPTHAAPRHYGRVRLITDLGEPLRAADLEPRAQYVFAYPFAATPCFLFDLDRAVPGRNGLETEAGVRYDWPGGVGPKRSLVAYSAICAHKMAHPTRTISYISFRPARSEYEPEEGVISCCAENSRYDPASGARVIDGPADQPLAAILLEYDAVTDGVYAVGTLGGEMFRRFFETFEARLSLEYPNGNARGVLEGEAMVRRLEDFSDNVVSC
jgi:arsenite oxidase small subunit